MAAGDRSCRRRLNHFLNDLESPFQQRTQLHEIPRQSSCHRRRRRRLLGAVPPRPRRLDRHHADRALGADLRLVLACGRRLPHAERRPQRRQAAGLHGAALQGARGNLRPVLLAASDRRRHAGRHAGAHGLPAPCPRQGPLSRHGHRADHAVRSQGDVPADGRAPFRRRHVGPGRRPSRPVRHHHRLFQGGQEARRRDRARATRSRN